MSQINYKLADYDKSISSYVGILESNDNDEMEGESKLDADEIMDIITNYLACQSSIGRSSLDQIQSIITKQH